ncbi:MAG: hypothetical protein IPH11_05735 [Ignavibacteriales bacterium]|nr:hypothetical protein [Ignavibacteriales bacterium]
MKLLKKIRSFFKNDNLIETEKFVIAQKSCPHCASRGLFVFKDNSIQISKSTFEIKHSDVTLNSSKGEEQNN